MTVALSRSDAVPLATGSHVAAHGWGWRHAGRKAWALHDICLDIAPGERVLVLGASGAGKSTLLGAMAGVLGGEEEGEAVGTLTVDDRAPEDQRGRIGLVMQDPEAQVVLARAGDDVAFGCENLGVPRRQIWPRVDEALDAVGLDLGLDHPTSKLSGGQKQRLALASVLAMHPGLLLLDEPTANLDPRGVAEVRVAAERVVERTGATLVVIEHRVDVWADLVDRAIIVLDGTIAADGPLGEVLRAQGDQLRESGIWLPGDEEAIVRDVAKHRRRTAGEGGPPVLIARDLTIGYDHDRPVRHGLDPAITRGGSTCIVGANGTGKTTLALTLAGLLPELGGSVAVAEDLAPVADRTDPHRWRSRELLGRLSMVFQEPEYQFVARTVREELEVGPRLSGVADEELKALVDRFLTSLALESVARANPMTLSGGEKRRLSVATALISAPSVLILDEPTFGQDRSTWLELVAILRRAVDAGTTLISITHDPAYVAVMGDEVIDLTEAGTDARVDPEGDGDPGEDTAMPGVAAGGDMARTAPAARPRSAWREVLAGRGLHLINPVTQILALVVMTTPLLVSVDVLSAGIALVAELLLVPLSGIGARRFFVRMVPLVVAAPLSALSMLLYASPGGQVYWQFGPATISEHSVSLAVAVLLRVLALGMPAIVLLSRIDPTDMADGLSQVLHLPARPVLASLAGVRMTGLMVSDWKALEQARRIRGIGDGNRFIGFFRGAFALLVFALRRSAKLSVTMEARGFGAPVVRTWARESTVGRRDAVMMAIAVLIPVIAVGAAIQFGTFQLTGR